MTSDEKDILREHGESLASIKTSLDLLRRELNGRIPKLEELTTSHSDQINFWRGALALLAFVLLFVGGAEAWHIYADHTPNAAHVRP